LHAAGQVPQDGDGALIGHDDPAAQAVACLDNLQTLLGVHGFAVEDIRRLTVYVVGEPRNLSAAWDAVVAWFDDAVPPATLLGVNRLGYADQLVEVDATIVRRDNG
jgi:enamine deaminase RidA (YjgF/YER057c/UK114 family)